MKNFREFVWECDLAEGKVEWDNPKRPLQSGLTPREKNRAVRKRSDVENPDKSPSERDYERYGKLKIAHETEKDKKVPDEKRHKFKPETNKLIGGDGKNSAGRIRRKAGVNSAAQRGKNKDKKRYGDYDDLKRLKEPKD
tara:strand:- start:290 stop:706 length:417 start_codon:yes stop_codon:yes gene_type:complete